MRLADSPISSRIRRSGSFASAIVRAGVRADRHQRIGRQLAQLVPAHHQIAARLQWVDPGLTSGRQSCDDRARYRSGTVRSHQ